MSLNHVHLTPQLVQAVRDAVDVVAVASEHTRLKKAGQRYSGLCPLHKEKSPSFSVDPVQGLFYCFGCGRGGDAIRLHMLLSGDDFPGAIEALAGQHGIPLPTRRAATPADDRAARISVALAAASEYFIEQLKRSSGSQKYLAERQIPGELIESYGLGFAPDGWQNLLEALQPKLPLDDLIEAGLVGRSQKTGKPYDRFRNRLMFPIHTATGKLVGFGGRTLDGDRAKYVNTAETEQFRKGTLLYGLHQAKRAIRDGGQAILVEGYFDVMGAVAAGAEAAVAGMGTALTADQARLLARYADEVVIGYDGDDAGQNAFRRTLPLLLSEGLSARKLDLGELDPDSYRLEHSDQALIDAVESSDDAVVSEIRRLTRGDTVREPRLQARAASSIAELLRPIPDSILRFGYGRQAADRLGVPVELLWKRFGTAPDPPQPPPEHEPSSSGGGDAGSREMARRKTVRTTEQRVIELLLSGAEVPAPDQLPEESIFRDERTRNIYRAFYALYTEGSGLPPVAREVQSKLANDSGSIDEMAQILLENSVAAIEGELQTCIYQLERKWQDRRLRELAREIRGAEEHNDTAKLERLVEERFILSRSRHGRSAR